MDPYLLHEQSKERDILYATMYFRHRSRMTFKVSCRPFKLEQGLSWVKGLLGISSRQGVSAKYQGHSWRNFQQGIK